MSSLCLLLRDYRSVTNPHAVSRNTYIPPQNRPRRGQQVPGQKLHLHCISLTTFQPHPWAVNARAAAERGERLTEEDGTLTIEDVFGGVEAVGALVIQVSLRRLSREGVYLISFCAMRVDL